MQALSCALDGMNVEYSIISDKAADVYAKVNVSKLALMLAKENCEVISMQERDESLESYYVSLLASAPGNYIWAGIVLPCRALVLGLAHAEL